MLIGLGISIPVGTYACIALRSGLAIKWYIDFAMGVVDANNCSKLGVVLINNSDDEFRVQKGRWIAQLMLEKISTLVVEEVTILEDTSRGAAVFGSTRTQSGPAKNFGGSPRILLLRDE